ncbi:MAG: zf-HC2 domain-containing protein [Deltaproteobacteria bacterium]|nr:zf-HC2 domain-containing protein [Deltaproteobacteria bacterium]
MKKPYVFFSPFRRRLDCDLATPLIGAFRDGELSGRVHRLVGAHLDDCDRCRAEAAGIGQVAAGVREAVFALAAGSPDMSAVVSAEASRRARLRESGLLPLFSERLSVAHAVAALALVIALAAALVAVPLSMQEKKDAVNDCIVESLEYSAGEVKITAGPGDGTVIWLIDDDEAG